MKNIISFNFESFLFYLDFCGEFELWSCEILAPIWLLIPFSILCRNITQSWMFWKRTMPRNIWTLRLTSFIQLLSLYLVNTRLVLFFYLWLFTFLSYSCKLMEGLVSSFLLEILLLLVGKCHLHWSVNCYGCGNCLFWFWVVQCCLKGFPHRRPFLICPLVSSSAICWSLSFSCGRNSCCFYAGPFLLDSVLVLKDYFFYSGFLQACFCLVFLCFGQDLLCKRFIFFQSDQPPLL